MHGRCSIVVACLLPLILFTMALGQDDAEEKEPRDLGLSERAGAELVQLDVSVSGPPEIIADLGREDFRLKIWLRVIDDFTVDRICREYGTEPDAGIETPAIAESTEEKTPGVSLPPPPPASYVFFFDMPHLTMTGYHRSFELAEELIEDLFPGNVQGMIVSTARDLSVVTDLTADKDELLDGLERLKQDRAQYSTYAMQEEDRVLDVIEALQDDIGRAEARVRHLQGEEIWHAERSLNRISMVLGRLHGLDPPKAFFYFADTMRGRAGEHFSSYSFTDPTVRLRADLAALSLDRIVNEASSLGIRFYTIEAQGLTGNALFLGRSITRNTVGTPISIENTARMGNGVRVTDAQDTLGVMAHETGGKRFINGVPGKKIAQAVRDDLTCLCLISFDPEGFDLDEPLPVRLKVLRPGVRVRSRGRLVIPSASSERTTRLLAAFATSRMEGGADSVDGRIVPIGFERGRYRALVQITVPPTRIINATWDVGGVLIARGKGREAGTGRITTATRDVPSVLEKEMEFPPGPFELSVVAHETTTDQVFSHRIEGEFPDPNDAPVTIPPLAVVQSAEGAFLRDGQLKTTGVVAIGDHGTLKTNRDTAIVGLVCRAKFNRNTLSVKRSLTGESSAEFGKLEIPAEGDRCVQFRDLMPAKTMTEGGFRYDVWVYEGETEIAHRSTEFFARDSSE